MNELGTEVLLAMYSQNWTVVRWADHIVCMAPGPGRALHIIPAVFFEKREMEGQLMLVLLNLLREGLQWEVSPEGGPPVDN